MLRRFSVRLCASVLFGILAAAPLAAAQRPDSGTLSIQVRPPDAAIFVDGEGWVSPVSSGPVQIQLPPGRHLLELQSPGHRPYRTIVDIRPGQTTTLNVSLPPGPARARIVRPTAASAAEIPVTDDEDGFVIAPDIRVAEIDRRAAALAGAYGGYVFGGRMMLGAGGYWQTNAIDGGRMAYGGPVLEWRVFNSRRIGFNLHGLIGGGEWHAEGFVSYPPPPDHLGSLTIDRRFSSIRFARVNEQFFVAEPEAQIVIRFGAHVRVQAGAGYRATSASGLNGASGSISVQVGK